MINAELAVGAGSHLHNLTNVTYFCPGIELVEYVIDKGQVFLQQLAHRNFLLLAEVDNLSVDAVAGRPPLVFHDQSAAVEAEALVLLVELVELDHRGLDQRGQRYGFFYAHGDIAHAEFEGVEEWMRADVPPDFLGVVDATGLDQEIDEVLVLSP